MKRLCLFSVVCISAWGKLLADKPSVVVSFEDRLKRLEQDSGIDVRPERTDVFFFGDFILWKASLDGVAYATTSEIVLDASGNKVSNDIKSRIVHFDYSPAFQIGMGIGLPHDHWDITLLWLRSQNKGRDVAHGAPTNDVGNRVISDSIGLIEDLNSIPTKAKANCQVHLDVLDGVLGRTFLWSRYFWFRPFAGIRGVWVSADWDISYKRPLTIPSASAQSITDFDVDNEYTAVGFVGGFDTKWNFYKGLGLFSHATASLIYGDSSEKSKQKFFGVPANQSEVFKQTLKAENSAHVVKGIFDIALGVKWETDVFKKAHILLWAGYDFFYLPNVTQKTIVQETRVRDRADLSYEGLVLGGRVIF